MLKHCVFNLFSFSCLTNIGFILHRVMFFLAGKWWLNIHLSDLTYMVLKTENCGLTLILEWCFLSTCSVHALLMKTWEISQTSCKLSMKSYSKSDWKISMGGHKLQHYEKRATKHVCVCRRHPCISQLSRPSRHGVIFKQALCDCTGWLINALHICISWVFHG